MSDTPQTDLLDCFAEEFHPLVAVGKRFGIDVLNALLEELGGQKAHFPTRENFWRSLQRHVRNEEIKAKFRGNNHAELELEYGLSERQLRTILAGDEQPTRARGASSGTLRASNQFHAAVQRLAMQNGLSQREATDRLLQAALESEGMEDAA